MEDSKGMENIEELNKIMEDYKKTNDYLILKEDIELSVTNETAKKLIKELKAENYKLKNQIIKINEGNINTICLSEISDNLKNIPYPQLVSTLGELRKVEELIINEIDLKNEQRGK